MLKKSLFIKVLKEADNYPSQPWVDKELWRISKYGVSLQVRISDEYATVCLWGHGACMSLISMTPQELKENINAWWRNRDARTTQRIQQLTATN